MRAKVKPVDVQVSGEGGIFLFEPLTLAAAEWIRENVSTEATWYAGALVVEHRYAEELARGMGADGLEVR